MNRLAGTIALLTLSLGATADPVALVGGTVHTAGPQGTIENATIVIDDGQITAVGGVVAIPIGAQRIDVTGKILTPGLVSPVGRLGLVEVGNSAGPRDYEQRGDFTASFDIASAYNPRSTLVAINRIEGITTAVTMPSPGGDDGMGNGGHVLAGQAAVVSLADSNWLLKSAAGIVVSLGEAGSARAGGTRTAAFLLLRTALDEARDYAEHKGDFERGLRREYSHSVADLDALQGVLSGTTPLIANVDRASDIEALLVLASDYGVRLIINGGAEAWMIADKIAAANASVVTAVLNNLPGNFDRLNSRRGAAKILIDAGVEVALTDSASHTHNARNLTQSAGNAIADGLTRDAALRAITLAPAKIYGVADRVGSIEAGKDANIVVWPDDPFELTTFPDQVYLDGVAIPMQSRQTLLRDRYMKSDSELPPAYRK